MITREGTIYCFLIKDKRHIWLNSQNICIQPFHINGHVGLPTQRIMGRRRGAKWHYATAPPRRAMDPDRNCRQLNCPVPIAHRGGGSAEVALEAAFSYNIHACNHQPQSCC